MSNMFEHLLVLGRPASGKSEFIDFMKNTPASERTEKYHIGPLQFMDDFVWLWEKFEEDDIWEKLGRKRLYSKKADHAYVIEDGLLLDFMIERFNKEIKRYSNNPEFYKDNTLLIEFSRGTEKAYDYALSHLTKDMLERASILYISVDFEESWRRNVQRYQEKMKHSILAHMVPREDMDRYYATDDWFKVTKEQPNGYVEYNGVKIPFVTMPNTPELKDHDLLDERYGTALRKLYDLTKAKK